MLGATTIHATLSTDENIWSQYLLYKDGYTDISSPIEILYVHPRIQNVTHMIIKGRICKRLRSPGIDSYVAWRAGTTNRIMYRPARVHRLAETIPRNQFLGSLNVYKFGLWILRHIYIIYIYRSFPSSGGHNSR